MFSCENSVPKKYGAFFSNGILFFAPFIILIFNFFQIQGSFVSKEPSDEAALERDSSALKSFSFKEVEYSSATSMYRGDPSRRGVYEIDIKNPKLFLDINYGKFNTGVHGASKAAPAVDETGAYLATDSGYLYSFSHHGKILWKWHFPDAERGLHSTPALNQTHVFVGTYSGKMYAIEKLTGEVAWISNLGVAIGSSPALDDEGSLYVGVELWPPSDGYLAKLDTKNGNLIWKSPLLGEQPHSSPTLDLVNNLVFIGSNAKKLHCFNMKTGSLVWETAISGEVKSTAVLAQDILFYTSWAKELVALNPINGKKYFNISLSSKNQSTPVIDINSNIIALSDGESELVAFSTTTKQKIWEIPFRSPRRGVSSPIILKNMFDKKTYFVAGCGSELCLINTSNGEIISRSGLENGYLTGTPTYWNGFVYASFDSPGGLYRWALK